MNAFEKLQCPGCRERGRLFLELTTLARVFCGECQRVHEIKDALDESIEWISLNRLAFLVDGFAKDAAKTHEMLTRKPC